MEVYFRLLTNDKRGQGGAEYLLLLGGVIVVAIMAIMIYQSYFNMGSGDGEPVDVTMNITHINSPFALKYVYQVNDTTNNTNSVIRSNTGQFQYLNRGQTNSVYLGKMNPGTSFTVMVAVGWPVTHQYDQPGSDWTGNNRWVRVDLAMGDEVSSWVVAGPYDWRKNPSGAVIKSFTVPGGGGGIPNLMDDIFEVRNKTSP
ncbi:class III signal peptide-containing protein [Methanobacterium alkalithermotolerans]|uniref:Class III signal peptide-containing protein n=1 Tax=Methanobacterium alkalithermotolerans TaxID=2731220 RepID=A0A8T8K5E8_9EURY|nr:class III signal peptide-containing protein [Methanobacterium alkalithermotolerans]